MTTIDLLDAEARLSQLVEAVATSAEAEIIIACNGKPAAKLVPVDAPTSAGKRPGLLKGKYPAMSQDELDAANKTVAVMFRGERD